MTEAVSDEWMYEWNDAIDVYIIQWKLTISVSLCWSMLPRDEVVNSSVAADSNCNNVYVINLFADAWKLAITSLKWLAMHCNRYYQLCVQNANLKIALHQFVDWSWRVKHLLLYIWTIFYATSEWNQFSIISSWLRGVCWFFTMTLYLRYVSIHSLNSTQILFIFCLRKINVNKVP